MALSDVIARLAVNLDLDTVSFDRNSSRAKREVTGLERHISKAGVVIKGAFAGMFGALAVDQLVRVANAGLDYASSLGEVASQLGVTTKALQEYRYAASQAGVEQGEMDQGLAQLTRRLGDAAQGAKAPLAAFERLGINIRDANGHVLDAGDAIPLIADGLQKIESPAERAAILVDLFGKAGQKLAPLLEGGAAGVNGLRDAAHKLGIVLSEDQIQNADETADKLSAMKQVLEAKIAGTVASNAKEIAQLADQLFRLADAAIKAAAAFSRWINGPGGQSARAQNSLISNPGQTDSLFTIRPASDKPTTTRTVALQNGLGQSFSGTKQMRLPKGGRGGGRSFSNDRVNAVGDLFGTGERWQQFAPGTGQAGWMASARAANDVADASALIATRSREAEVALGQMAAVHGPRLLAAAKQISPEMEKLRGATLSILDRLFPDEAEVRRYAGELATLTAAMKAGQLSTEDYARAVAALRQEYNGFADLVANNQEIVTTGVGTTLDDALAQADASWDRFTDGLEQKAGVSRVEVVKTFDQMAQDVIGTLDGLAGAIKGGGFLDILSAVIQVGLKLGSIGVFGKGVADRINAPLPRYAAGTDFHPGGLALVGERGPELVDLPRGSAVLPNHQLGGMGNVYHISGNLLTPEFWAMIQRGDVAAAQAGAAGGEARVRRKASRRVA